MRNLFEFEDYRVFLKELAVSKGKGGKVALAGIVGCQPGYLSQIFAGQSDLSPEQAERLASHMAWDVNGTQYFLSLVAHARAGTPGLKKHVAQELERLRAQSQVLKNRFKPQVVLSVEDQATFYSSWHFGAVHVSVSVPGCDSVAGLARYFHLPEKRVNEIVQFLLRTGLVRLEGGGSSGGAGERLVIGSTQVYVGTDSPLVSKHHTNWRMRAVEAQDRYRPEHLHYSSVVSCSRADAAQIREILAGAIQQVRAIVRASKDEACFSYAMDLFEVGNE